MLELEEATRKIEALQEKIQNLQEQAVNTQELENEISLKDRIIADLLAKLKASEQAATLFAGTPLFPLSSCVSL